MAEYRSSRTLYEVRDGSILNQRKVHITTEGDLVVESYDLDPLLETMMGDSDYEREAKVSSEHVERVRLLLGNEFGFIHTDDPDAEVLDVLVTAFGDSIHAYSKVLEWLDKNQIPHKGWSY